MTSHYKMWLTLILTIVFTLSTHANQILQSGEQLNAGESITLDEQRTLLMQDDGNLVIYSNNSGSFPIWSTNTAGYPNTEMTMQSDGNLVVRNEEGDALWSSHTEGYPGATYEMQEDGNLVIYDIPRRISLWSTHTAGNPGADYVMQSDGNLVIYDEDGNSLWSSGTAGNPNATLEHQSDGNLVIYSAPTKLSLWSSGTSGNSNTSLRMQSDGNLVLYNQIGQALWSTGTYGNPGAYYEMQADGNLVVYSTPGKALWSSDTQGNHGAEFIHQSDGNLVIYSISARTSLWSTHTENNLNTQLIMQADGNLVLYSEEQEKIALWSSGTSGHNNASLVHDDDGNYRIVTNPTVKKAIWASNTSGNSGAFGKMEDNGNFVIYSAPYQKALWASNTSGHPGANYIMQSDGNLVIYDQGEAIWSTRTYNNSGAKLIQQDDGNNVIYDSEGKALWSTQTSGNPGASLVMQDDGNLVVYGPSLPHNLWETGTQGATSNYLQYNNDGNLVVTNGTDELWESSTLYPWMSGMADTLSNFQLNELVLPGTHDSGTYDLDNTKLSVDGNLPEYIFNIDSLIHSTPKLEFEEVCQSFWLIGPQCLDVNPKIKLYNKQAKTIHSYSKAQNKTIWEQLQSGIRYLDYRLVNQDGIRFAHALLGSDALPTFSDISRFASENPNELIIIDIQHVYEFNDDRHQTLMNTIYNTLGTKLINKSYGPTATLSSVLSENKNIILLYTLDDYSDFSSHPISTHSLKELAWLHSDSIRSTWHNTSNWSVLMSKLKEEGHEVDTDLPLGTLFVLQAQITPDYGVFDDLLNLDSFNFSVSYFYDLINASVNALEKIALLTYQTLDRAAEVTNPLVNSAARAGGFGNNVNIIMQDFADSHLVDTAKIMNAKKAGLLQSDFDNYIINYTAENAGTEFTIPTITAPAHQLLEATAILTPVSLGTATAFDAIDGVLTTSSDASESLGLGAHSIIWRTVDSAGINAEVIQNVIIEDSTAPVITAPQAITTNDADNVILGEATATDIFDVTITSDAPETFHLGVTTVTWTATDSSGNTAIATQEVTITEKNNSGGSVGWFCFMLVGLALLRILVTSQHQSRQV